MAKNNINYDVGTIFCIPLKNGKFARGIVARHDGGGQVFGYFFGPSLDGIPNSIDKDELHIEEAIFSGIFSGMGLSNDEWKQLGRITSFRLDDWPLPLFINTEKDCDRVELIEYDEDTLEEKIVSISTRGEVDINAYPEDGLMGYEYVENVLTMKLDHAYKISK
ncbi:MAG: Imm26 family immunity protein [Gimesia sp.]|nr:Imm26 family immunity protein [Gimesia sp.]